MHLTKPWRFTCVRARVEGGDDSDEPLPKYFQQKKVNLCVKTKRKTPFVGTEDDVLRTTIFYMSHI